MLGVAIKMPPGNLEIKKTKPLLQRIQGRKEERGKART